MNPQTTTYKLRITAGLTVLEMLIVLFIITLVTSLIIWPFSSFRTEKLLDGAAADTLSLLHEAQTRTLSSEDASQYGVYFENTQITLFKGSTFPGVGNSNNKIVLFDNRLTLQINSANIANNGWVVFNRLTGETDQSGRITISLISDGQKKRVIHISPTGVASLAVYKKLTPGPGDDEEIH